MLGATVGEPVGTAVGAAVGAFGAAVGAELGISVGSRPVPASHPPARDYRPQASLPYSLQSGAMGFLPYTLPSRPSRGRASMEQGNAAAAAIATKRQHNVPPEAVAILCEWFDSHNDNPYPSEAEKADLARTATAASMHEVQISLQQVAPTHRREGCLHSLPVPGGRGMAGNHVVCRCTHEELLERQACVPRGPRSAAHDRCKACAAW